MANCFYFSINVSFQKDYDVSKLQKIFGIKARKLTYLKDSVGPTPSAKFSYYTPEFNEVYTDSLFAEFIEKIYKKAKNIKDEIENNDGKLTFCIVFKQINQAPCLSLSNTTLTQLVEMGANYDVDFI